MPNIFVHRLKLKPTPIHLSCNDVFQLGSESDHSTLSVLSADSPLDTVLSHNDEFVPPAKGNCDEDSPAIPNDYFPDPPDFLLPMSTLEVISSHSDDGEWGCSIPAKYGCHT